MLNVATGYLCQSEKIDDLYDIEEELGRGQFAVVKRCIAKKTKTAVAAKFIKLKRTKVSRAGLSREAIERESDILWSIDHENIIHLLDVFDSGNEIVLILELLSGGELFDKICEMEYMTEVDACLYLKQVLEAVDYLHEKNIVHLDIKPENIVLKSKGGNAVKLVDFGLAQKLVKGKQFKEMMGTPEFVAPEIISYEDIGLYTDMWAIGVLTYVLLSGYSPFLGENNQETYENISKINYDFDDDYFDTICEEAKEFVSSLLVKNPRKRNSSKDCLSHAWLVRMTQTEERSQSVSVINTIGFKAFVARRKWKGTLQKLCAVSRFAKNIGLKSVSSIDEEVMIGAKQKTSNPVTQVNPVTPVEQPERPKSVKIKNEENNEKENGDERCPSSQHTTAVDVQLRRPLSAHFGPDTKKAKLDDVPLSIDVNNEDYIHLETDIPDDSRLADHVDASTEYIDTLTEKADTVAENVSTVDEDVDMVVENVDTVAGKVDTVAGCVDTVAVNVDTVTENVDTVVEDAYTVTENVDTVVDNVYTVAENVDTVAENVDTVAENVYTVAENVEMDAECVETIQTILHESSYIHADESCISEGENAQVISSSTESINNDINEPDNEPDVYLVDGINGDHNEKEAAPVEEVIEIMDIPEVQNEPEYQDIFGDEETKEIDSINITSSELSLGNSELIVTETADTERDSTDILKEQIFNLISNIDNTEHAHSPKQQPEQPDHNKPSLTSLESPTPDTANIDLSLSIINKGNSNEVADEILNTTDNNNAIDDNAISNKSDYINLCDNNCVNISADQSSPLINNISDSLHNGSNSTDESEKSHRKHSEDSTIENVTDDKSQGNQLADENLISECAVDLESASGSIAIMSQATVGADLEGDHENASGLNIDASAPNVCDIPADVDASVDTASDEAPKQRNSRTERKKAVLTDHKDMLSSDNKRFERSVSLSEQRRQFILGESPTKSDDKQTDVTQDSDVPEIDGTTAVPTPTLKNSSEVIIPPLVEPDATTQSENTVDKGTTPTHEEKSNGTANHNGALHTETAEGSAEETPTDTQQPALDINKNHESDVGNDAKDKLPNETTEKQNGNGENITDEDPVKSKKKKKGRQTCKCSLM